MDDPAPFILTLTLEEAAHRHFDALRTAHFPPDRLFVGAHVTLFHALPPDLPLDVVGREAAACETFTVSVSGVRFLGRGVAFELTSAPLLALRERLRAGWAALLTAQDRQPWRPHVTIQNKVDPAVARALHAKLAAGFVPYPVTAEGLALWIYRGGPWEHARRFEFQSAQARTA